MYSEKLESIPKNDSQALTTYLSEIYAKDGVHITRREAARETGVDERIVQTIFSELTASGILKAEILIRCPHCSTQHGTYERKSHVPDDDKICFNCGNNINRNKRRSWEVIYKITDEPGDFFQNKKEVIKYYVKEAKNLPPSFFRNEFEEMRSMDDPQNRGRRLDGYVGLLFQQIPGVNVRLNDSTVTGEVDVYLDCLEAEQWIRGIVGNQTMIENKWKQKPTQTSEISKFRQKTTDIHGCEAAYFLSMSGFSRGQRTEMGAMHTLKSYTNPKMIDLWDEHLEQMIADGTPENVLRDRLIS